MLFVRPLRTSDDLVKKYDGLFTLEMFSTTVISETTFVGDQDPK
jgi:hypothetical protein